MTKEDNLLHTNIHLLIVILQESINAYHAALVHVETMPASNLIGIVIVLEISVETYNKN